MTLADARAILPRLVTAPHEAERDAAFLRALARWARHFTPLVAQEAGAASDHALMLETAGSAHLFGGEAAMLEEIEAGLARFGLTLRLGLADTKGAAWALARFGGKTRIAPPGETRQALAHLPVVALRLQEDTVAGLMRLGLKTIGDLARTPRASLARRFGVETVRLLDRALGIDSDPLTPSRLPAPYAVRMTLPEPVGNVDAVMAALDRLLARLCGRLSREELGARRMVLTAQRADGGRDTTQIGLIRATRDADVMRALFARPVEALDAGFGFDMLRLEAVEVEPLTPAQLRHEGGSAADKVDALLSRLGNRLGFDALERVAPAQSHIPEHSWLRLAAAYSDASRDWAPPPVPRPITLIGPEPLDCKISREPPIGFRWRGKAFRVAAARGPERILPEWWLDDPAWRSGLRDYWHVETDCARRFWLYHTPEAETGPRWFLHGAFA